MILFYLIYILVTLSLLIWLYILFDPARPWDFSPVGDDGPVPAIPASTVAPDLCILVPARNEAESLPRTLPALLAQDYPGAYRILLIDDRSDDGTAEIARKIAAESGHSERLLVIKGQPLPDKWTGKVWALDQGVKAAFASGKPGFFLLTDADILHAPASVRRLVSESMTGNLALNSRMARLRCASPAERMLIPAFVFFFNLLYPMRKVNDAANKMAAAAGGCVLLSAQAVEHIGGGFESIRSEIIDDVNLGRQVKKHKLPIRLSLSRTEVVSLREYPLVDDIWRMVRRTAFTELKYSWLRLAGSIFGLLLLFVIPFLAFFAGVFVISLQGDLGARILGLAAIGKGALVLAIMRVTYSPAVRFFELPATYSYTLPWSGVLYGMMTFDSALRYARGKRLEWRNTQGPV